MPTWDPTLYGRFAAERARPFTDLLARVDPDGGFSPRRVVDLGCGPGTLTAGLARRWPQAQVLGLDSSHDMITRAHELLDGEESEVAGRLSFVEGDVARWAPPEPVDLVVTNAVLQWVPGHLQALPRWVSHLAPGGRLALQVPADFDAPLHALMRGLATSPAYAERVGGVRDALVVHPVADYTDVLARAGCEVDAWETTYLHLLDPAGELGDDAVLTWISGTGLRPVTDALADDPPLRDRFVADYAHALRQAYPRRPYGTPLSFSRRFAVARRPSP